jgi:hypothetical protein
LLPPAAARCWAGQKGLLGGGGAAYKAGLSHAGLGRRRCAHGARGAGAGQQAWCAAQPLALARLPLHSPACHCASLPAAVPGPRQLQLSPPHAPLAADAGDVAVLAAHQRPGGRALQGVGHLLCQVRRPCCGRTARALCARAAPRPAHLPHWLHLRAPPPPPGLVSPEARGL